MKLKTHQFWVHLGPLVDRNLPKGSGHGGDDPQIEFGHVSKMCRMLKVNLECIETQLSLR